MMCFCNKTSAQGRDAEVALDKFKQDVLGSKLKHIADDGKESYCPSKRRYFDSERSTPSCWTVVTNVQETRESDTRDVLENKRKKARGRQRKLRGWKINKTSWKTFNLS